jgi:hypothetical protein
MAWWTIWKEKPAARFWGIAASLVEILIYFRPIIFHSHYVWWHHAGALYIGIVGLVVFSSGNAIEPNAEDTKSDNNPS